MKIKFLGSAQEVGRSCILLNDKYLLDAGIKIGAEESEYPIDFSETKTNENEIEAVFLSHAHLDHTGALPLLNHYGLKCSIYATKMTRLITKVLLNDSIHIEMLEGKSPAYSKENINNVLSYFAQINYNKEYKLNDKPNDLRFKLLDAGHIPGSGSFLINTDGKNLLYTGDINSITTRVMTGLTYYKDIGKVDVMICESTYGDRNHEPRENTEEKFLEKIEETLDKNGSVLIPAFSVGRAQEILIILDKRKFDAPIYLDGMAKKVTDIITANPDYIKDIRALKKALEKVNFVNSYNQRKEIVRQQGIFVTTSGMLDGGPAMDYIKYFYHDEKNAILLTGYQAENCNGRLLLEKSSIFVDGSQLPVKAYVEKFDFSAHSGQKELVEMIKRINPKHLILNHGDSCAIKALAKKCSFIKEITMPKNGEVVEV